MIQMWVLLIFAMLAAPSPPQGVDPTAVRLPGTTQPSPAQQWLAETPEDSEGFAEFDPAGQKIFIAPDGKDSNVGTESAPIATYKRAEQLLVSGQGASVLFQRGGSYTINDNINTSGKDEKDVLLISAYGDPAKPRPIITNQISIGGREPSYHFIVLQSLDIEHPNFNGVRAYFSGSYLWIEDCRVADCPADGIMLQSAGDMRTIILRRNVIVDCQSGDKCQGVYASGVHDLLIDSNLADHNGWHVPADRSIFSHDFYLQFDNGPIIFTNNFCSNAASHGVQQRSGGINAGNYYFRNSLAYLVAKNSSIITGNVAESGAAIKPTLPRGQGLEVAACNADVGGNLFIDKMDPVNNMSAMSLTENFEQTPNPNMRVNLHDNIVYHWLSIGLVSKLPKTAMLDESNDWNGVGHYVDPSRDLDTYAKSIGLADADAFIAAARNNCRGPIYDPRLCAAAAVSYVQAGFVSLSK
jgi:hypothetical protein